MKKNKFRLKERNKTLISMIKDNKYRLIIAMFLMIIVAGTTSATAFLIKPVLDDIFFKKDLHMLKIIPIAVLCIYLLRAVSTVGQSYLMTFVGEEVIRKLRNLLYDRIMNLPMAFFQKEKTGVLISRITNDVNIVKAMVSTAVTGALRDCFTIIGLTGVIFYRDWQLASFAFFVLPLALIPFIKYGRKVRKVSTGTQETMAHISSFLHETFAGNKIVKAFCMESHEKNRFFIMTEKLFRLQVKAAVARQMSSAVMEFLAGVGVAFIIWYGGYRVISGTSTPGTFFSFMAAVLMLYDPARKLSEFNNAIQEGMAASDRIFEIIERKSDIVECDNPIDLPGEAHEIEFRDISFKYDRSMVLKNIQLQVKKGEVLGIVGMSGGGKSSLVNLIPRFFDISDGAILIDGIDIRKASIKSLRDQIAIVTQDPILFNDTIRNNIAYGHSGATGEEIIAAAKSAYAYDFIQKFPQQFETPIGELGGLLSGGEKQRLCIARALIKDAPILILDEATSSLDTESENFVQKALENLMKGRTTFMIAHRLSTIRSVDRIIVLVNGEIKETGKHEELLAKKGEYYKLHEMQFQQNQKGMREKKSIFKLFT
ncbi:Lipid A export ATP-binding/permease protein msbA [Candidatus Magnetomorum sp. HK-1]|nr:Lipid A export ATP-binding/permease protein msbA [Candidatus Magnetomorum sp. HK-1]